ncbi:Tat proofreading chaperone DmsD [Endozoicomonas sp. SCSIO W0465]|uniref:Tat proofreading chaperone DmsD n=1 Tax=Endozoicomonas sp. SCSIO W0465 TaxID=2918516 RepID=UPI0020755DF5|nr:Tat proofreading chaperone DmsD [Endozoicomonas sp. SCSIO W0465]USE38308.1 Tat proofreading chaperone DmsD [Endozoicomonas sp. SCSIO W0465]
MSGSAALSAVAVLPRMLGTLFYYSPTSEEASNVITELAELPALLDWQNSSRIEEAAARLCSVEIAKLPYQFSLLFEGQGVMSAPPWGSVYLDRENLLLGETAQAYRQFLRANEVELDTELNEPEDQFGLMILAMAYFMETENDDAVVELLGTHLLPWSGRYLALLAEADESGFYRALALVAEEFLKEVSEAYEVTAETRQLYR